MRVCGAVGCVCVCVCVFVAAVLLCGVCCGCFVLLEKDSSHLVHEANVLHDVAHQVGVMLVPDGIPLAHLHDVVATKVYPLVGCLVSHVVAHAINLGDQPLVDHLLSSMALDLRDVDGSGGLGLDKVGGCLLNVPMKPKGFVTNGRAVSGQMYWALCSNSGDSPCDLESSRGSSIPRCVVIELEACHLLCEGGDVGVCLSGSCMLKLSVWVPCCPTTEAEVRSLWAM